MPKHNWMQPEDEVQGTSVRSGKRSYDNAYYVSLWDGDEQIILLSMNDDGTEIILTSLGASWFITPDTALREWYLCLLTLQNESSARVFRFVVRQIHQMTRWIQMRGTIV